MNHVQQLEPRTLLASIAPDLDFGTLGEADVGAELLVAAQPGGKILAVDDSGATRLNEDGSVDSSFTDNAAGFVADLTRIRAGLSGSRLIMAGRTDMSGNILVRAFNLSDGSIDTTFAIAGTATITPTSAQPGNTIFSIGVMSISATPDGGMIIGTTQQLQPGGSATVFYKLDSAGQPVTAFGDNGVFILDEDRVLAGDGPFGATIAVAPDGKLLIHREGLLTRFFADATIDTNFADQGNLDEGDVIIPGFRSFSTMLPLADGRILISINNFTDLFPLGRIVRLTADGQLDTTFGDQDHQAQPEFIEESFITGISLDSAGRIVAVAGNAAIVRFTAEGEPDTTFDDDGMATLMREVPFAFNGGPLAVDELDRLLIGEPGKISRYTERDRVVLHDGGVLRVDATEDADTVTAAIAGDDLTVSINGQDFTFDADDVMSMSVFLGIGENELDLSLDLNATIVGGRNFDIITTGHGDNYIETGDRGRVVSGDGNDTIIGDAHVDITSNGGDDDILILPWDDFLTQGITINAGSGDDRVRFAEGARAQRAIIHGGSGNDSIQSSRTRSTVFGDDGDDTLMSDGSDQLVGGAGNDSIEADGDDRVDGGDGDDFIRASFRAFGAAGNDTIIGGSGNELLYGEAGDDSVEGGGGTDTIRGGEGNDHLRGDDGDDLIDGQNGNDLLDGGLGNDTLLGGAGLDKLLGNGGGDRLYGGDDFDRLYGQDGNDLIFGGAGDDLINGGAGFDVLRGEDGNDLFHSNEGEIDSLIGHDGRDTAFADRDDVLRTIEVRRR